MARGKQANTFLDSLLVVILLPFASEKPWALGEAVQDIYMRNRTPIRTYRIGEDVDERISETTGRPYYQCVTPANMCRFLKNQPPGYAEKGLVEVRYGGRGEITDAGLQELNELIAALVGPEVDLPPDQRVSRSGADQGVVETLSTALPEVRLSMSLPSIKG